jgi:hypothetical protein
LHQNNKRIILDENEFIQVGTTKNEDENDQKIKFKPLNNLNISTLNKKIENDPCFFKILMNKLHIFDDCDHDSINNALKNNENIINKLTVYQTSDLPFEVNSMSPHFNSLLNIVNNSNTNDFSNNLISSIDINDYSRNANIPINNQYVKNINYNKHENILDLYHKNLNLDVDNENKINILKNENNTINISNNFPSTHLANSHMKYITNNIKKGENDETKNIRVDINKRMKKIINIQKQHDKQKHNFDEIIGKNKDYLPNIEYKHISAPENNKNNIGMNINTIQRSKGKFGNYNVNNYVETTFTKPSIIVLNLHNYLIIISKIVNNKNIQHKNISSKKQFISHKTQKQLFLKVPTQSNSDNEDLLITVLKLIKPMKSSKKYSTIHNREIREKTDGLKPYINYIKPEYFTEEKWSNIIQPGKIEKNYTPIIKYFTVITDPLNIQTDNISISKEIATILDVGQYRLNINAKKVSITVIKINIHKYLIEDLYILNYMLNSEMNIDKVTGILPKVFTINIDLTAKYMIPEVAQENNAKYNPQHSVQLIKPTETREREEKYTLTYNYIQKERKINQGKTAILEGPENQPDMNSNKRSKSFLKIEMIHTLNKLMRLTKELLSTIRTQENLTQTSFTNLTIQLPNKEKTNQAIKRNTFTSKTKDFEITDSAKKMVTVPHKSNREISTKILTSSKLKSPIIEPTHAEGFYKTTLSNTESPNQKQSLKYPKTGDHEIEEENWSYVHYPHDGYDIGVIKREVNKDTDELTKKIHNERILTKEELKILGIIQDIPNSDNREHVIVSVKINIHYYLIGIQESTYDMQEEIFGLVPESPFPTRYNDFQQTDTVIKILSELQQREQETTTKISTVTSKLLSTTREPTNEQGILNTTLSNTEPVNKKQDSKYPKTDDREIEEENWSYVHYKVK